MAGRKPTQVGDLAKKAIANFPKSSKRTIATYLHKEYPAVFTSFEQARNIVNQYTVKSRMPSEGATHIPHDANPFLLPDSRSKERLFKTIPKQYDNIVWLSDIHFPNHDLKALTCALNYAVKCGANCIVLGGDILDNEPFTRHDAPPPGKNDVRDWFEKRFWICLIKNLQV